LLLVVDNGSIYTKNLTTFLSYKKTEFTIQKFDEISLSNISEFNSFILSGRIENNRIINAINSKIIKHAISEKKSDNRKKAKKNKNEVPAEEKVEVA